MSTFNHVLLSIIIILLVILIIGILYVIFTRKTVQTRIHASFTLDSSFFRYII